MYIKEYFKNQLASTPTFFLLIVLFDLSSPAVSFPLNFYYRRLNMRHIMHIYANYLGKEIRTDPFKESKNIIYYYIKMYYINWQGDIVVGLLII